MPRNIVDIEKELDLKKKTDAKTEETIKKMEERVRDAAKKISELRPKIDDLQKLIALNEKALKDPKTKASDKPGLTKQKLEAEKKLAPLETAMETATTEYDATKKNIDLLKKKDGPLQKKIEELEKELAEAKKGVEEFGESRTEFKKWYEVELRKMKTYVDHIGKAAAIAERLLGVVIKDIGAGHLDQAAKFTEDAKQAAAVAEKTLGMVVKLHEQMDRTKTDQRNLNPKEFGITHADIKIYDAITKSIYGLFAQEDRWVNESKVKAEETKECAEEAATWVQVGSRSVKGYETVLTKTLEGVRKMASDVDVLANRTWGQIIMNEGAKIAEMAENYRKNSNMLAPAIKMVEQASAYVPETLERVRAGVGRIDTSCKKAMAGVPGEWKVELKGLLGEFVDISETQEKFLKTFITKSEKTNVEIEKLRDLVGA